MADARTPIPSPQPGDSDDVELALETSQRLYKNGDLAEALKWLRRAANSAEEAGDDLRQLQLARVAADLAAEVSAGPQLLTSAPSIIPAARPSNAPSRLPQPPSKQPPPAPSGRGTPAGASHSGGSASATSAASASTAPSSQVQPQKALGAVSSGVTPQPPATSGGPPPLPSDKSRSSAQSAHASLVPSTRPSAESQIPAAKAGDSQMPPPTKAAAAASIKPRPSESTTPPAPSSAKSSVFPSGTGAPTKAAKAPSGFAEVNALPGAVRVFVRVSARDEHLYIVRPLAQGQRVPPGAREARLVFDQEPTPLDSSHGE